MSRRPHEWAEDIDRYGRWRRTFTVRSEPWFIVEHWASEHEYRLVSIRGDKRTYAKMSRWTWFATTIEFHLTERRFHMTSWVLVSFLPRLLSLFSLPEELHPYGGGFKGIRIRRQLARDLSNLLMRFKQPPIEGSNAIHPLDLPASTLVLMAAVTLPLIAFLTIGFTHAESVLGFNRLVLESMGKQLTLFTSLAVSMVMIQLLVVKFYERRAASWVVGSVCALSFLIFTSISTSRNLGATNEYAFTYHCLHHYDENRCRETLARFSEKDRDQLMGKILFLEKELSYRH